MKINLFYLKNKTYIFGCSVKFSYLNVSLNGEAHHKNGTYFMSTQNKPTNGAANGTAENSTQVISLPKPTNTDGKPELSNLQVSAPTPDEPEKPTLSIEDIFFKMDKLYSLRDKRDKLKDSLDKLMKFKLSSDSRTDNIILSDKNGSTFTTYNPKVIAKTIDWLKEDLTKKIEEVENQIRTL